MGIDNPNVVDAISMAQDGSRIALTIFDAEDRSDEGAHLFRPPSEGEHLLRLRSVRAAVPGISDRAANARRDPSHLPAAADGQSSAVDGAGGPSVTPTRSRGSLPSGIVRALGRVKCRTMR